MYICMNSPEFIERKIFVIYWQDVMLIFFFIYTLEIYLHLDNPVRSIHAVNI